MMNFLKKSALAATLAMLTLSSVMVFAKITHTLLVVDTPEDVEMPKVFRTTSDDIPDNNVINRGGLDGLHLAGSQQFSDIGLRTALGKIPGRSVVIVDLRRESHGMLNHSAVSWYGPQNAANANKTPEQVSMSEARLLAKLKKSTFKWVYEIVEKTDDDFVEKVKKEFVRVNSVKSEKKLASEFHVAYKRFYVEDFHKPDDQQVDRFVAFARKIPASTWIYFHCRAGRGRTTTFMAMYDMMKNAKQISFDDIIARQAALGGSDLKEMPDTASFKYKFAVERFNFLKKFYEYCKTNNDNYSITWSQRPQNYAVKST